MEKNGFSGGNGGHTPTSCFIPLLVLITASFNIVGVYYGKKHNSLQKIAALHLLLFRTSQTLSVRANGSANNGPLNCLIWPTTL